LPPGVTPPMRRTIPRIFQPFVQLGVGHPHHDAWTEGRDPHDHSRRALRWEAMHACTIPAPDALRCVDGLLTAHPSERKVPAVETHASPCRSLSAALALPRDKPVSPRMPCRPRRSRATARTRPACPGISC
jgi:hypothetical protein